MTTVGLPAGLGAETAALSILICASTVLSALCLYCRQFRLPIIPLQCLVAGALSARSLCPVLIVN